MELIREEWKADHLGPMTYSVLPPNLAKTVLSPSRSLPCMSKFTTRRSKENAEQEGLDS